MTQGRVAFGEFLARLVVPRKAALRGFEDFEFANSRRRGSSKNIQPDMLSADAREDVDFLVSEAGSGIIGLPGGSVCSPGWRTSHFLSVKQPLHGQRAVEGNGMRKIQFNRR